MHLLFLFVCAANETRFLQHNVAYNGIHLGCCKCMKTAVSVELAARVHRIVALEYCTPFIVK